MDEKKEQHKNRQNKARILVVDDHAIVREGLALLINQKPDLSVCVEAESANQALDAVAILSMRDEVLPAERAGTVRLVLSHPGARGQRDDASV